MDLVELSIRLHDGGEVTRLATTAQNIHEIEARYLASIPGAIDARCTVIERDVSLERAGWLYQAQQTDWFGVVFRHTGRAQPSHAFKPVSA